MISTSVYAMQPPAAPDAIADFGPKGVNAVLSKRVSSLDPELFSAYKEEMVTKAMQDPALLPNLLVGRTNTGLPPFTQVDVDNILIMVAEGNKPGGFLSSDYHDDKGARILSTIINGIANLV